MGHLREKYTAEYYLHRDRDGNAVHYGADGLESFLEGSIRIEDLDILERIDFRGKRVLDLGCGRGEALKYAAEHGAADVHGVDFSKAAIEIARQFLHQANVEVQLHCADALEFLRAWAQRKDPQSFDVVTMLDCIEHIPRSELSVLLRTLLPLMSRRAVLAVNTPAFGADNDLLVEGLKPRAHDTSDDHEATAGMHCNRYTRRSLKRYLRGQGFAAVSHHLFVPHWRPPRWLEATHWALRKAAKLGYPILLPRALKAERYCGVTWRSHPALAPARWLKRLLRGRPAIGLDH